MPSVKTDIHAANPIKIVDLFCGVGGLSLGWLDAQAKRPVEVVAAVDADPSLAEVYAWNAPHTPFLQHSYGDPLAGNEAASLAKRIGIGPGDADVVLAGPPCQTFSAAGKRTLQKDSRLVLHVCDFAEFMQPAIVLIENVPEFSRVEDGRLIGRVRVRLAEAGYDTEFLHLSAADFGVPQLRTRCFTLAVRKDFQALQGNGLLQHLGRVSRHSTVEEAIDDLPSLAAGEGEQEAVLTRPASSLYQTHLRDVDNRLFNHVAVQHSPELLAAMKQMLPGETPQQEINHPLRRKAYFTNAYARLDPKLPALTMTTQTQNPGSGRFTHYRDHRVITVREVARLQSFPDSFRFFGTQAVQRRHIGNAVPPLLAQTIAASLLLFIDT